MIAGGKPPTPVEPRKGRVENHSPDGGEGGEARLANRGEIHLDAEDDFKDEKNFAVVITKAGAASLKDAGIPDPADHFKGKTIRATGTVKEVGGVPRMEIDKAEHIAGPKGSTAEVLVTTTGTAPHRPAPPEGHRRAPC